MSSSRAAFPPEIVAQRRRRRAHVLRVYVAGTAAMALLIGAIFALGVYEKAQTQATNEHIAMATGDLTHGHTAAAVSELRLALASRDDYAMHYDLGGALLKAGADAESLAQMRVAEGLNDGPSAYLYAMVAGLALHRPALVLHDGQEAVARAPGDLDTTAMLALVYDGLGHPAQAAQVRARGRIGVYNGGRGQRSDRRGHPRTMSG